MTLTEKEFASVGASENITIWELGKDEPIRKIKFENSGNWLFAIEKIDYNLIVCGSGSGGDYSVKLFNW